MMLLGINLAPVAVAAIASMAVGMTWFSKSCFGPAFIKESNLSASDMPKSMGRIFAIAFVNALVTAYVLALFIALLGVSGWQGGAQVAGWVWFGFVATGAVSAVLWARKSMKWFWIHAGRDLVMYVLMGAIIAAW